MFHCNEMLESTSGRCNYKKVKEFNPEQIILLPLYPQYSNATSGSSIKEWLDICKKENLKVETKIICCYPTEKDFILSYANLIKEKIETETT